MSKIIAVGDDGSFSNFKIAIASTDGGATWSLLTTAISDSGNAIIYSAALGLWIIGTDGASTTEQLQTSPDGASGNWTAVSTPADHRSVYHFASGVSSVVAVYKNLSNQIDVMYTTDGVTWTPATLPSGVQIFTTSDIAYSPDLGRFVIVDVTGGGGASAGAIYSDDDGVTWTFASKTNNLTSRGVTWGNSLYVSVGGPSGSGEHLQNSANGTSWTIYLSPPLSNPGGSAQTLADVRFADSTFVAVSDSTSTSPGQQAAYGTDGVNWTLGTTPTGKHWICVAHDSGSWFAGDSGFNSTQPLMTSTDGGATWSLITLGFSFGFINDIASDEQPTPPSTVLGNTWRGGFQQRIGNTFG